MKFLIISDYACINGGNAKVAIQTAVGLSQKGHDVTLFAGGGKIDEMLIDSNVNVIDLNQEDTLSGNKIKMFFKGINNKYAMKELKKLLSEMGDDVIVHVHSWMRILSPGIFKILSMFKCKVFLTAHDYFLLCPNGGFYNYKKNVICSDDDRKKCSKINCDSRNYLIKKWRVFRHKKQKKYLSKLNLNIITLSSLMKAQFDSYEKNSVIVKNPIDMNYDINNVKELKKSCFAYIGRLSSEKGIEVFCEALKLSGNQGLVFGDGPLLDSLIKKYSSDNIKFMGWKKLSEIITYTDSIVGLVFPSKWYEGAPLTIPEFGSYGIPAIVSDACSGVDYINEKTGYVFESNNIEDLINKMSLTLINFSDFEKRKNVYFETVKNNYGLGKYISTLEEKMI